MICPFCGRPMVTGFVQARDQIYFTEKKHKFFFAASADDVILSKKNMTCPTCLAYHCPDCKKVVIDYE